MILHSLNHIADQANDFLISLKLKMGLNAIAGINSENITVSFLTQHEIDDYHAFREKVTFTPLLNKHLVASIQKP